MLENQQKSNCEQEMLENLARLVKYNSVQGVAAEGKPFGESVAACLNEALEIAREMGFETCNMDNYCGWAQIGEGDEIIGIAAHLDVVPAGDGWKTDPFTLTRIDDKVYGRGVSDDKGAVIASLYAMKALKESGMALGKRIRLILGCNEESGSECMKYYSEHGEAVTLGFTPDGNFPGIYGEKGICALTAYSKKTNIISMNGGTVSNAVCSRCETIIKSGAVNTERLLTALKNTALSDFAVKLKGDNTIITAVGVSAHASTPLLGVNAAGCTMAALKEAGFEDDFVNFYLDRIGNNCNGEGIGCKIEDAYGVLTLNNGIVSTENGTIKCTIDIRFPVTLSSEELLAKMRPFLEDERGRIECGATMEPLFYPPESELVKSLHDAYVKVTGDAENQPMVIGGGTYAKSLSGIIAFGCEFPDVDNHIHDANECLAVSELGLQTEIYIEAIKNLLAL